MKIHEEEAVFGQILKLLNAQRQLLEEKFSPEDQATFTQQSKQIQDLLAKLTRDEGSAKS